MVSSVTSLLTRGLLHLSASPRLGGNDLPVPAKPFRPARRDQAAAGAGVEIPFCEREPAKLAHLSHDPVMVQPAEPNIKLTAVVDLLLRNFRSHNE